MTTSDFIWFIFLILLALMCVIFQDEVLELVNLFINRLLFLLHHS
jgi:hypothetical protein